MAAIEKKEEEEKSEKKNPFKAASTKVPVKHEKIPGHDLSTDEDWVSQMPNAIVENDVYDTQLHEQFRTS